MRNLKRSGNSVETKRIRKILNEEARLGISPNSESETEEVDLQKELHPLGHYINNREDMIEQMFSIIKGPKLKKMLPPILKDMPFDELKADCLIHLLGMSKKRIRAILDGREIDSSSDSETHSDSSSTPSKRPKVDVKPFVIKQEGCSDISDNSEEVVLVDPDLDFLNVTSNDRKKVDATEEKKTSKRKSKRKDLDKKHKRTKNKVVEQSSKPDLIEEISSEENASENETETQDPKEGKNLLEILELQMRAKAIKALLTNIDTQEDKEPKEINEIPSQNPTNKSHKQLKEATNEKITPTKNFRKKKRKSDDVIVIAPKLVTIDLTDENEHSGDKNNKVGEREENVPSSSQNNSLHDKSQECLINDSPKARNKIDKSPVSERTTVACGKSNTNEQVFSKVVASCSNEKICKRNSLDKTPQSEHAKSSWTQRWLESKEVKKVVSTSKICGNIRKKIKSKLAKKQSQDESAKPSPVPQEMEGSVVEYKLLSKSNVKTISDVDGVTDNDTQGSVSSANQDPTSSEANLIEISSADQVQDVSSTRVDNASASLMQDIASASTNNADATFDSHNEVLSSNVNVEESDVSFATDGEFETSDRKCLNKDNKNLEKENICSSVKTELNTTVTNENEDENGVEEKEEENLKLSQGNPDDNDAVTISMKAYKTESNDSDEQETYTFLTEHKSNTKIGYENEGESDLNNKNDIEPNPENKKSLEIESETLKTILSVRNTNTTLESNEPETLEIYITEEDRDIEDVAEENVGKIDQKI